MAQTHVNFNVFYDKFSDARMATLFSDDIFFICFSFCMDILDIYSCTYIFLLNLNLVSKPIVFQIQFKKLAEGQTHYLDLRKSFSCQINAKPFLNNFPWLFELISKQIQLNSFGKIHLAVNIIWVLLWVSLRPNNISRWFGFCQWLARFELVASGF